MANTKNWTYDMNGTVTDLDTGQVVKFNIAEAPEVHEFLGYPVWNAKKDIPKWKITLPREGDSPRVISIDTDNDGKMSDFLLDAIDKPVVEYEELRKILGISPEEAKEVIRLIAQALTKIGFIPWGG